MPWVELSKIQATADIEDPRKLVGMAQLKANFWVGGYSLYSSPPTLSTRAHLLVNLCKLTQLGQPGKPRAQGSIP